MNWPLDTPPAELAALLAVFSYKPGWSFKLGPNEAALRGRPDGSWSPFGWMLQIQVADVLDAYGSGRRSTFITQSPVPVLDGSDAYMRWLKHVIDDAEAHESGEWFVVDGQRPYDPHTLR